MSNQHTSQDEVSGELKKFIMPMPRQEKEHTEEIGKLKKGFCNQKDGTSQ